MIKVILDKIKESSLSVAPVLLIVIILNFTPLVNFSHSELFIFIISGIFLILGMALFNLGSDMAMTPMGKHIGSGLTKSGKLTVLLFVAFLMGVLITVAEPDLSVLAAQVKDKINSTALLITVGVGVGIFLTLSIVKIIARQSIGHMLMFFYLCLFAVASLLTATGNGDFLALSFDSGGVTTGPITVPFIMALGIGIAASIGGHKSDENSFGLVALCSIGPIIAVMALGILSSGDIKYKIPDYSISDTPVSDAFTTLLRTCGEVAIALALIVGFFMILQTIYLKLPKKKLVKICIGVCYTFIGLVIFLTAVSVGFMPIGYKLGVELASESRKLLAIFGFVLGAVVVLAEPAVHVLNKQVEEITDGAVSKRSMITALSVGVGISICLSMIRIIFDFSILYYLIPGYIISLGLSFFVPGLYTAIAFDSGGVASGPLTSSFILPLAIGACYVIQGEAKIMSDAFGIVAMVAMTPLITIQLLGFRAVAASIIRKKNAMRKILAADDEQIISFDM